MADGIHCFQMQGDHIGYHNKGYNYFIDGQLLQTTDKENDLRVLITSDLKSRRTVLGSIREG